MTTDTLSNESPFNAFATQMTLIALCNPELHKRRGTFHTSNFDLQVKELGLTTEQKRLLFDSVAFAKSFFKTSSKPHTAPYNPVTPRVLDRISAAADSLLTDILTYFPAHELDIVFAKAGLQSLGPICGDFYLSPQAQYELRRISGVAKMSAGLVRKRAVPNTAYMRKAAYLWPALYIESVTGKPHYQEVAELLALAGLGQKTPEQLSKAAKSVREKSPSVAQWLVLLLPQLPGEVSASNRQ